MPSVSKQPSNEQESTHFFIMVLRAPRSSIKGKQGKEWVSRQRLRQAKVGKEGELPVLCCWDLVFMQGFTDALCQVRTHHP